MPHAQTPDALALGCPSTYPLKIQKKKALDKLGRLQCHYIYSVFYISGSPQVLFIYELTELTESSVQVYKVGTLIAPIL